MGCAFGLAIDSNDAHREYGLGKRYGSEINNPENLSSDKYKIMKRITVYCASSPEINKVYFDATEKLGELFVKNNCEVVFGGGSKGLMGKLADAVLANNGKITGIMPQFMNEVEWGHKGVTDFVYTETMAQRKEKLIEKSDGIVALPGGCGTLEELLEVITFKRLGLFSKPIIILNTNNFYDPLKSMLERCVDENFMQAHHLEMWQFVDEPEQVIDCLSEEHVWKGGAIKFK